MSFLFGFPDTASGRTAAQARWTKAIKKAAGGDFTIDGISPTSLDFVADRAAYCVREVGNFTGSASLVIGVTPPGKPNFLLIVGLVESIRQFYGISHIIVITPYPYVKSIQAICSWVCLGRSNGSGMSYWITAPVNGWMDAESTDPLKVIVEAAKDYIKAGGKQKTLFLKVEKGIIKALDGSRPVGRNS